MNWGIVLNNYPLPEGLLNSYLEIIKQEMRDHVSNGGKASDERSKRLFLKLCRIVDTFNGKKIDWDKTAEDYLGEEELNG